jgi:lactoylglutathione lyase
MRMENNMAKMIHSMIRVADEARSVGFYQGAFGLSVAEKITFDSFSLIYLSNAEQEFELELTVNHNHPPYELGNGYGHLAVSVEDVAAAHQRISALGAICTPVRKLSCGNKLIGTFFFVTDPDGYKIEVLQRAGRFK